MYLKNFIKFLNLLKNSSELLFEHEKNIGKLTPKKLCEIQNKSYFNLKKIIPILDRTGKIYSDISKFMENSFKK